MEGTNVGSSLVLDHDTRDQERTETSFHGCKDLYDSSCRHSITTGDGEELTRSRPEDKVRSCCHKSLATRAITVIYPI